MSRTTTNARTAIYLLAAVFVLSVGCASKPGVREQFVPGSGIAEYRQITDAATEAIQNTLSSLDVLGAQSNQSPAEALSAFTADVQRLQIDSIRVRARSQAILSRGEAYFECWHETLSRVKDPEVRALAETRRPLLQESFQRIKRSSEQCQVTFKPFLSDLRALRNSVESNPDSLGMATAQAMVERTRNEGRQLLQHLALIRAELDSMQAMLTPPRVAPKQHTSP